MTAGLPQMSCRRFVMQPWPRAFYLNGGTVAMKTYAMNQITWTKEYVKLPSDHRQYGTHHLVLLPDDNEEVQNQGTRSIILMHNRTRTAICRIVVEGSDTDNFQALQNVLLMSKF